MAWRIIDLPQFLDNYGIVVVKLEHPVNSNSLPRRSQRSSVGFGLSWGGYATTRLAERLGTRVGIDRGCAFAQP